MNSVCNIVYGNQKIDFRVCYCARKTLEISVLPDCSVEVRAPIGTAQESIAAKVKKRAAWIVEKQNWFAKFPKNRPSYQYMGGETHLYMGRRYRLKIEVVSGAIEIKSVKISGSFIVVFTRKNEPQMIKKLLEEWLRERAVSNFGRILEFYIEKYAVKTPLRMQIRYMKTRWGSLSKGGVLTLNSRLIAAPKECIEYVIVHELCHLKHDNHGKAFFLLLEQRLPDWEKRKDKLERL